MRFPSMTTPLPVASPGACLFQGLKTSGWRMVVKTLTTEFSTEGALVSEAASLGPEAPGSAADAAVGVAGVGSTAKRDGSPERIRAPATGRSDLIARRRRRGGRSEERRVGKECRSRWAPY